MQVPSSPIFSKTYDFLLWLLQHTEKYPKSERFRMARRLEDCAFLLHETLIEAAQTGDCPQKLNTADISLIKLKHYLRLSHDRKLMSLNQYEHAAKMLVEIGKLLGGWLRSINFRV